MVRRRTLAVGLAATWLGLALSGAAPAPAAEPEPTAPAASIEPAAGELLRAALERLGAAKSFSFVAEVASDTSLPSGQRLQHTGRLETAVRRPDGLRSSFEGEQRSVRSWYDGKIYTLLDVGQNVYACSPGPGRLEDLLDTMKERFGFTPPLSLLLHEDVAARAFGRMQVGFVVGPATLGGVPVQHLAFRGAKADWQVWVTEGPEPVIKRLVITFKQEEGAPQFTASFLSWDFGPRFAEGLFDFVPPAGAAQCDFRLLRP